MGWACPMCMAAMPGVLNKIEKDHLLDSPPGPTLSKLSMALPRIGIAAAAAASGLSAHTLRVWERRYGFPCPVRTKGGERLYSAEDVSKLTLLRRLLERGHRIRQVVSLPAAELELLAGTVERSPVDDLVPLDFQECLRHLGGQSIGPLRRLIQAALIRQGLERFVLDTMRPLIRLVGDWWAAGQLQVFQEHLFVEQAERLLRDAMAPLEPHAAGPTVILTTLPGEQHRLGLLMMEAVLRLEGAVCVPLGAETPPSEIAKLCQNADVDVIALSFSGSYADPNGRRGLTQLRRAVAQRVEIWTGGDGAARVARGLAGIEVMTDLEAGIAACRARRAAMAGAGLATGIIRQAPHPDASKAQPRQPESCAAPSGPRAR